MSIASRARERARGQALPAKYGPCACGSGKATKFCCYRPHAVSAFKRGARLALAKLAAQIRGQRKSDNHLPAEAEVRR